MRAKNRVLLLLALWVLAPVFASGEAQAAVIYVSEAGNDSNSCTALSPCRSIQRAEELVRPGDIVEVGPGTYPGPIMLRKAGLPGNKIVYRGHGGVCPSTPGNDVNAPASRPAPTSITGTWIVEASHVVVECFRVRPGQRGANAISVTGTGTAATAAINRSFVDIRNNYIEYGGQDCAAGVTVVSNAGEEYQSTDVVIEGNFITGCAYGISVRASRVTILNNEIYQLRSFGTHDMDYVRLFGNDHLVRGNFFHGNMISACTDCHIDCVQTFNVANSAFEYLRDAVIDANTCLNAHQGIIMRDVTAGNPGTPTGRIDKITVTNNVIGRGPIGGSYMPWCMLFDAVSNLSVLHNTCLSGQVVYRANSTGVHRNNVHLSNTASPVGAITGSMVTIRDNLMFYPGKIYSSDTWPGNILNIDPLFVDAANLDVRLRTESPARSAGASLGVNTDRDGRPRPATGPDLGAHQYSPAPVPPRRLRVVP